ncbi:hypothetical protein MMC22_001845 [Lobaria immixta]|nr:hypothetical protein [Lobaria immixta]
MRQKRSFLSSACTGFSARIDDDDFACDLINEPEKTLHVTRELHAKVAGPWILSTLFFAVISILLYFQPRATVPCPSPSSFDAGFSTDFLDAKPVVALEQRIFDGAVYFNESSQMLEMETNPNLPQFVGPPSPEIDQAWYDMLRGRIFTITEQDALAFPGLTTLPNTGKYYMELDMFHSLHCLNILRRELDREYYSQHGGVYRWNFPPKWDRVHMDHCIDQLRQNIQCAGDLTPLAMYSSRGSNISIGRSTSHTCRNFDNIRSWLSKRDSLKGY